MINQPQGSIYGGSVAAPVLKKLQENISQNSVKCRKRDASR